MKINVLFCRLPVFLALGFIRGRYVGTYSYHTLRNLGKYLCTENRLRSLCHSTLPLFK